MTLPFTHLTHVSQLTPETVSKIFAIADQMEEIVENDKRSELLTDCIVALLFYEPSSRTMLSFQAACKRLSAGTILAHGKAMSSMEKGENIEDTIRMVAGYSDLIVLRHPDIGSADKAAGVSDVPVINGGDGGNQHPTQSILDLYTIQKETGALEGHHIALSCDPKHSRTIRSLALLLSNYQGTKITFVAPESLRAGEELIEQLRSNGAEVVETDSLAEGAAADILYMNRLQSERFEDFSEFEKYREEYCLTAAMLEGRDTLVLDPLPRVGEIAFEVDSLPNAAYFRQAKNGVAVRMALLAMLLGKV